MNLLHDGLSDELTTTVTGIEISSNQELIVTLGSYDSRSAAILWGINSNRMNEHQKALKEQNDFDSEARRIPGRGLYTEKSRAERLKFIEDHTGETFDSIAPKTFDPESLTNNIENLVGSVEIPVGLVGPLLIMGEKASGLFYAPFGASEGALVASASRGARLLTASGGVTARVLNQRMMRAPLFHCHDIEEARFLSDWVIGHIPELRQKISEVSNHAVLTEIEPIMMGRAVHINFVYETGDAAGQNMTTTTTWHACQWIIQQMRDYFGIELASFNIDSNISGDKKVNLRSFIAGRGIRVLAEAFIPKKTLLRIMKVEPEHVIALFQNILAGGIQSGVIGANINIANTIAAIFASTGQDMACVHESSLGQLQLTPEPEGIYCSLLLPSLIIGTVGGGTGLPNQNQFLKMIGCAGPGHAVKLAEIIASYCLALDLSTLSALANGTFASAHEKLGRNRPIEWLKEEHLTKQFVSKVLHKSWTQDANLISVKNQAATTDGSSIITELTSRKAKKFIGHKFVSLELEKDGKVWERKAVIKSKPIDQEVILMLQSYASISGPKIASLINQHRDHLGFTNCHSKEIEVYRMTDPKITKYMPEIMGTLVDRSREAFLVIMETFEDLDCLDKADVPDAWTKSDIQVAIHGAASFHSMYFGKQLQDNNLPWLIEDAPSSKICLPMKELFRVMLGSNRTEFPDLVTGEAFQIGNDIVDDLENMWRDMDQLPHTLIHNDFNPRNLAINNCEIEGPKLFAYDWELATWHIPQRDLMELLAFTISEHFSKWDIDELIEQHRDLLSKESGLDINPDLWLTGCQRSIQDFFINRLGFYLLGHTSRNYEFVDRLVANSIRLLKYYGKS